jgi:5-dehydro-4-deoxyglucarate dehydratase
VAIDFAREAERQGAAGILLLPHYLVTAGQEGVAAHVDAVCKAVKIGVIVYNRNVCRLGAAELEKLTAENANLIGFKDGIGDIELLVSVRRRLGDRLAYLCGMPTAEIYAAAYRAVGVPVYSSAVFNFVPNMAMDFYRAIEAGDRTTCDRLLDEFFLPLIELRNRGAGYAVSIIKAGARLVGHDAGPVRSPLTDLKPHEVETLAALIERLGPQ